MCRNMFKRRGLAELIKLKKVGAFRANRTEKVGAFRAIKTQKGGLYRGTYPYCFNMGIPTPGVYSESKG